MAADTRTDLWMRLAPPKRNAYYPMKALDVPHMRLEQEYGRIADALHQRLSLGTGVLCGLQVSIVEQRLLMEPGVAVDGWGRTIVVPGRVPIDPWGDRSQPPCCGRRPPLDRSQEHEVTLYLCYRECETDARAVSLSNCSPPDCAWDSVIETWCLDVRPGPLATRPGTAELCAALLGPTEAEDGDPSREERRNRLCRILAGTCAAPDDPCVPLAWMRLTPNGIVDLRVCDARQRLYSNELLFEMILCLAERVDQCCGDEPEPEPFRIAKASIVSSSGATLDAPDGPDPAVNVTSLAAIELRFDRAADAASVIPQAADIPAEQWSVRVERTEPEAGPVVIEGLVTLSDGNTLATWRPRGEGDQPALPPGSYRLIVTGTAAGARAPVTAGGTALDGEPTGFPTGDGSAGGDFVLLIQVEERQVEPLRVIGARAVGPNNFVLDLPAQANPRASAPFTNVIEAFEVDFSMVVDPASVTPAQPGDPAGSESVLVERVDANGGTATVPGLAKASPSGQSIRFDLEEPSPPMKPVLYRVTLFGDAAGARPAIRRASDGVRLDGEPVGLPSGDGTEGGNFVFEVELVRQGDTLRVLDVRLRSADGNRIATFEGERPELIRGRAADKLQLVEITFSDELDPASVSPTSVGTAATEWTFTLERTDRQGNARKVLPLASLQPNGRVVEVRFPRMGVFQPGAYVFTAIGDPARRLAITRRSDAALLDGEPGGLPSGDGAAGGDFRFEIRID